MINEKERVRFLPAHLFFSSCLPATMSAQLFHAGRMPASERSDGDIVDKQKKWINKKKRLQNEVSFFVGIPGLEPGKTGPESVVLPLHHSPIYCSYRASFNLTLQRYNNFITHQIFRHLF